MVIFREATERPRMELICGSAVMLVQHIFELLFGIAVKSDELEPEAIISFPSDDGQRDHDRRPGTGRLYMETQMRANG